MGLASADGILKVTAQDKSFKGRREPGWYTYDPKSPTRDDNVLVMFSSIADNQRGDPEISMVKAQRIIDGGPLTYVIEHGGDLIHRLTEFARWRHHARKDLLGTDYIKTKGTRVKQTLDAPYGIARDHKETMASVAAYKKVPLKQHKQNVDQALQLYVNAHAKLKVYNEPQFLCRLVAILIGEQEFKVASSVLGALLDMRKKKDWVDLALAYKRDKRGHVVDIPSNVNRFAVDWPDSKGDVVVE